MDEFEFIARYLAPLTGGVPEALNLKDDAALLTYQPGKELVITTDALSCGTHFLPSDDPRLLAGKVLRVNLSDLAAMGAVPKYYLMTAFSNSGTTEAWMRRFVAGLRKTQEQFNLQLIGGDTVRHKGPVAFSVTMIGEVTKGKALLRSGAKSGEDVYVSGTIGDAVLGLMILQSAVHMKSSYLVKRYQLPQPRLMLGQALTGIASACIDISDGLIADAAHIAKASKTRIELYRDQIPLSAAVRRAVKSDPTLFMEAITGGDDYELLFTVPKNKEKTIRKLAKRLDVSITKIGRVMKGRGIALMDHQRRLVTLTKLGFTHF